MIRIHNSKKKIISIGHYKVVDVLQSNKEKDIFHVKDLKNNSMEYTLKILKSNQNPKQIDNEIEILNLLNPYQETLNFRKLEIFSDKLLLVFDYANGKDLLSLYNEKIIFFDKIKIKLFVQDMLKILKIYKDNNICHRNIKAENIIFDGEHFYLIGLSKAVIDKNCDQKEDIKAFISVLYFLLTEEHYSEELQWSHKIENELSELLKGELENNKSINLDKLRMYIDKY